MFRYALAGWQDKIGKKYSYGRSYDAKRKAVAENFPKTPCILPAESVIVSRGDIVLVFEDTGDGRRNLVELVATENEVVAFSVYLRRNGGRSVGLQLERAV